MACAKPIANPTFSPNKADISAHLYALIDQAFVHPYPDACIEIAYGYAATGGKINAAKTCTAFQIEEAVEFAATQNRAGCNIYVGAALRHGERPKDGRA